MIYAVLVTYNPELNLLKKSLKSLFTQVEKIVIIDNSPSSYLQTIENDLSDNKYIIKKLNKNLGIAAAQNIGIDLALNEKADFILLSDQDTIFPENYVKKMLPLFQHEKKIAAVAPRFNDKNKKSNDGFISNSKIFFKKIYPTTGTHEVLQVIASGKIIDTKNIRHIGTMNESLFIDWVDLEWCWRARKLGYKIIANADICIEHHLGDSSKNLYFREINLRSHVRNYYITRNAFYLSIYSKSLDTPHKIVLFFKSFRYIFAFPIISDSKLKNIKAVYLGFIHGLTRKLGEYK